MSTRKPKPTVVVAFENLDDETAIKHLEHRHGHDLAAFKMRFTPEPDRDGEPRRFRAGRSPWDKFHRRLHELSETQPHEHEEAE